MEPRAPARRPRGPSPIPDMHTNLRPERETDAAELRALHDLAFGQPQEARLVDALRAGGGERVSLVAEGDGRVVGHVLFTAVQVESAAGRRFEGMGLAPLAVLPEHQRTGVGSALVRAGLERLRARGTPFVVVLGHADYYPRFGFEPAGAHGLTCRWPVPEGVFQVLELRAGALEGVRGCVHYRPEFDAASEG